MKYMANHKTQILISEYDLMDIGGSIFFITVSALSPLSCSNDGKLSALGMPFIVVPGILLHPSRLLPKFDLCKIQ